MKLIDKVDPIPGGIQGTGGTVSLLSRHANNSFTALNRNLDLRQAMRPSSGEDVVISGIAKDKLTDIANKHSVVVQTVAKAPEKTLATKKPRVGLYRSWNASIDEGWTRWILENYGFAPITLRNGDLQSGHLLERLDAIIIPDSSPRQIMDGFAPGSIPGEYAGGVGETGVEALRTFVRGGGTLIAFNNASLFAIEALNLPVTNIVGGLKPEEFYCSGSLLKVELSETPHIALAGMQRNPVVMFERGPVFDQKPTFKGTVLATYPKENNPLASGYLLGPAKIQGKAAAMEVFVGSGRVYLFGFKPQWRGQSLGTYKLFFNAIYDSPSIAKPTTAEKKAEEKPATGDWAAVTKRVQTTIWPICKSRTQHSSPRRVRLLSKPAPNSPPPSISSRWNGSPKWKMPQSLSTKPCARRFPSTFVSCAVPHRICERKRLQSPRLSRPSKN